MDDTLVTVKGRTFRIRPFSAKQGAFMVVKVSGLLSPILAGMKLNNLDESIGEMISFSKITEALTGLTEEEFNYFHDKSLSVVDEKFSSGFTPVLQANGIYAVNDLEDDMILVLALMGHALWRLISVFMKGIGAGDAITSLPNLSQLK